MRAIFSPRVCFFLFFFSIFCLPEVEINNRERVLFTDGIYSVTDGAASRSRLFAVNYSTKVSGTFLRTG